MATKEELEGLLDSKIASHVSEWKNISLVNIEKALTLLNFQLSQYFDLVDSAADRCFPSIGNPHPRILLLILQPGPYDSIPFPPCEWLNEFVALMKEFVAEGEIHFMNIFPYFLGTEVINKLDKTSPEIKVFTKFSKKRIELLKPKLIIGLGSKVDRNFGLYLNENKSDGKKGVSIESATINGMDFNYLSWIHPFNFQKNPEESFLQERWKSAIECTFYFFEKERIERAKKTSFFKKRKRSEGISKPRTSRPETKARVRNLTGKISDNQKNLFEFGFKRGQ